MAMESLIESNYLNQQNNLTLDTIFKDQVKFDVQINKTEANQQIANHSNRGSDSKVVAANIVSII